MKDRRRIPQVIIVLALVLIDSHTAAAQGFGNPLTIQGMENITAPSAASRGAGGVTIAIRNDISLMFLDPASLQTIDGARISLGGPQEYSSAQQTQQYAPLKYYSNFSLLMEGLTGYISNPDTTRTGVRYNNAGDSVQRPFDKIEPNWSRSKTASLPVQFFAAMPFMVEGMKLTVGAGAVRYASLNWYFQNNNVLSPSILSVKQSTVTIPVNNADSLAIPVKWYQSVQSREGSITGYGGAISLGISPGISVGISGMILGGSSDDKEERVDRGKIKFYSNYIKLDSVYNRSTATGTSDYSGQEFTLSGAYRSEHIALGFSVKPPTTITRKFHATVQSDTTGVSRVTTVSGQDKLLLPFRGKVGFSIGLREGLTLGLEYEMRPYASAEYKKSGSPTTKPWLSSNLLHVGGEFTPLPWLALRLGVAEQAEVFEPVGAALESEPVGYSMYTIGAGVKYEGVLLNAAFEYASISYTDKWSNAVSINHEIRRSVIADVSYELPW